jgi:endonuclease/exonuclease/phosphatase family metal-dependent hydrolase
VSDTPGTQTDGDEHFGDFGPLVDTTMRVMTWNLWWRFGPWEARQPAILDTVRALQPDVLCLQEVWSHDGRSSAALVAEALGAEHVSVSTIELDGVGFGNAVVSRWPIVGSEHRELSSPPELDEFRTVVRADIDGPRGPFQVFCTHLHWRADHSHIRQQQVREICRFVAESPHRSYPAVLCGDFNADPDADEIRMLTGRTTVPTPGLVFWDAWNVAGAGPGNTWSNDNPFARLELDADRRLDYVFTGFPKPGGLGSCVAVEVVGTGPVDTPAGPIVPSDHYGVLSELRY